MTLVVEILSWVLILLGSFFTLVGALGMIRMPEVFTRMHAASVIDTLGIGLLIAGMVLQAGFTLVDTETRLLARSVRDHWPRRDPCACPGVPA